MKAIFIECSAPFWETVVTELQRDLNLTPVYWTGLTKFEKNLKKRAPDLVFHDCNNAKKCIPALPASVLPAVTFDDIAMDIWQNEAHTVYEMLTRFDFSQDFSYYERSRCFFHYLTYWYAVLQKFRPDVVIFPNAPHQTYDYIVYCLCKRLGIQTVMFDYTGIHQYSLTFRSYEEGDLLLRDTYLRKLAEDDLHKPVILSPKMEEYLEKVLGDYVDARPDREKDVAKKFQRHLKNHSPYHQLKRFGQLLKTDILALKTPEPIHWLGTLRKEGGKSLAQSFTGPFGRVRYEWCLLQQQKETKARSAFFERLTSPLDTQRPYIYVALSGQPERSSCPQSGPFTNQLIMVQMLSHFLPQGWDLYVKEHPNHFNPYLYRNAARHRQMYLDFLSIPNVTLLSNQENPFHVIEHAKAVATLAGTGGREAIVRGKPALVFGKSRYRFCEGAFEINTAEDCQNAINAVVGGYQVDQRKVRLFLQAMEETCFEGISDPLLPWFSLTNEENGRMTAERIRMIIENRFPKPDIPTFETSDPKSKLVIA